MIKSRLTVLTIFVTAAVVLSGCSDAQAPVGSSSPVAIPEPSKTIAAPSPTPERTEPPALEELVLSPEGLGDLIIGSPAVSENPRTAPIVFDEDYCTAEVDDPARAGKWIPNYEPALSEQSSEPFSVRVVDEVVVEMSIEDPAIRTADGLGLGSSRDEIFAAYPEARIGSTHEGELIIVEGDRGSLVFETVSYQPEAGTFGDQYDKNDAWMVRVYAAGQEIRGWNATDSGFAFCVSA